MMPNIDLYPVTLVYDRYGGVYSGAKWLAWNLEPQAVPDEQYADDMTCDEFWRNFSGVVGKGDTPNEALTHLWREAGVFG